MAFPLTQQLAQLLDVEPEDAGHALEFFARSIKKAAREQGRVDIPGLGSLIYEDESLRFIVEASLALAVNNRYAALETETVHVAVRDSSSEPLSSPDAEPAGDTLPASVGLEPADFPPVESDAAGQIEEPELSVPEPFRAEDQEGFSPNDGPAEEETIYIEPHSVDTTPPETPQFQSEYAPTQSVAEEPADSTDFQFDAPESMNNETPELPPNQDSQNNQSDSEWSSIFGKLEDQATFDKLEEQNTFEMPEDPNASRWIDSEPPMPPPSSPFADSREPDSGYNQGEVEDTLFARPADSDYTPLFIDSAADESSWADVPVEDASGLFDAPNAFETQPDNPPPAAPESPPQETPSFGDLSDAETIYSTPDEFSKDEFMPPSSASTSIESDETLFNAEPYVSPEDSTVHEQNSESFFMPDEAVASIGSTPAYDDINDHFAPVEEKPLKAEPVEQPLPPPHPPTKSRYEQRRSRQGSGSSFLLVALVLTGVLVVGAGVGIFTGFLPMPAFLQSGDAETPELAIGDPQTPPTGTETVPAIPPTTEELEAANTANNETVNTPETTPAAEPPAFQRRPIERAAGGWTIIVSSEQIKSLAEEKADVFAQNVQDQNLPVGVLDARVNGQIWYRVGIGQFPSRAAAQAVQRRLGSAIPGDAWLTEL